MPPHADPTRPDRPLRIVLAMRNLMYLRNYASTIRELARRGHRIVLFCETEHGKITGDIREAAESLADETGAVTIRPMPRRSGLWAPFTQQLRVLRDFARYQDPRLAGATKCARRAESLLYPPLRELLRGRRSDKESIWRRARACSALAARIELCLAPPRSMLAALTDAEADALVVTPLVDFNSDQVDLVKAAGALRLPCALAVASWDNLTNKGLIQVEPDRVLVWNEAQREEALALHGVPAERVTVTGAQLFDHWFERRPSRSREDFCRRVGLDPARPVILYTCSSVFIARQEAGFVARWLEALRNHPDPLLREAGVLIRPHPGSTKYAAQWQEPAIAGRENVAVFPREGGYPVTEAAQADYFDSLYHADAVFGINTSALLEAGIVGRPVFTVLDPEFAETQEGMIHFAHLTRDGFLHVGQDLETHWQALRRALGGEPGQTAAIARFVSGFLRPHGLDRPATPVVADAIEDVAGVTPAERPRPWYAPLVQAALLPAALWLRAVDAGRNTKKWGPKDTLTARLKTWAAIQLGRTERPRRKARGKAVVPGAPATAGQPKAATCGEPAAARPPLGHTRAARHSLGPETLEGLVDYAERLLDPAALAELGRRHAAAGSERKYLVLRPWLQKKWEAAVLLGLDQGPPLRILDLGTGAGHFPLVCRYLGHDCEALDMPGIPLFDDLCRLADVPKVAHRIEPNRPLPAFPQRFDLVTAFMIGFNTKPDGTLFDLDDWSFFLDDVRDNLLQPGGRLCLKLIAQADRSGPKFGDAPLMELFKRRGARLVRAGRYAIFEPLR